MPIDAAPRTLEFIKSRRNADGGWGYRLGGMSYVEPTAFAVLALHAGGEKAAAGPGLGFLRACLDDTGAMRAAPSGPPESWMSYAGLLAFHQLGAEIEERRLSAWMLAFEDASKRLSPAEVEAIRKTYRYQASIPGWSWTRGTTAWVESTALFIMALARTGVPASNPRIAAGVKLLIDRRSPRGGWSFGNPYNKSYEMPATVLSTALSLLALHAAGLSAEDPAVAAGLRSLEQDLEGDGSIAGLAWSLVAFRAYRSGSLPVSRASQRLAGLRAADGGFRGNIFESALSWLALKDPSPLSGAAGPDPQRRDP